ncbi:siderophore-interacting protein [Leucobacter viscericola]|uniref:Siderophore-interacting protein n=1 Tax=Leucobacter viscericola TaxID=2714935 RepID=A0A6G7XF85_9MICO|nr:siderophore-interacting protein [Leucobacter viscericola]QIK63172.1 siderophore-interacting protein [Leucobacter viscericola]
MLSKSQETAIKGADSSDTALEAPFTVVTARVDLVERPCPNFVRVHFVGPGINGVGTPGKTLDQRVKLIFPSDHGTLPDIVGADGDWYQAWLAVPSTRRGAMRTYSIRELQVIGGHTRLIIDFVLHLAPGKTGPASLWASQAKVGDELLLVGPRRGRFDGGGIEFDPGSAKTILLAGDETAAPAIARILEDVDPSTRGVAFIEVPDPSDVLDIRVPPGVEVHWLPRSASTHGAELIPRVLGHLGAQSHVHIADDGTENLVWETPGFSGSGEEIVADDEGHSADCYYWIAGESRVVTTLRRHLVKDLGIARAQVAFMGYWRQGVAMKG